MAFTAVDAAALIQDERSNQLLTLTTEGSKVSQAATTIRMSSGQVGLPVASVLPEADFVSYTVDRTKPSSTLGFGDKKLFAAEIAVGVPVREEQLEDADDALIDWIVAQGAEAIARKLDNAIMFGAATGYPTEWSPSLFDAATAAGNVRQVGTGANDLVGSILLAAGDVAEGGFDPEVAFAATTLKYRLQNLRDSSNAPIYVPSFNQDVAADGTIAGLDAYFAKKAFDRTKAEALIVDPSALILGVRTEVQVKIIDQGVWNGVSLAETDQVVFRFRSRYGYVLADNAAVAAVTPAAPAV